MRFLNKTTLPNLVALLLIAASYGFSGNVASVLLTTGLFALSGAITNWLAIHMLFERVPFLYGSGVVTLHFSEFKESILRLVTEKLFKPENVERAFQSSVEQGKPTVDFDPAIEALDFNAAFDQLVQTLEESRFGSVLNMMGGSSVLESLREPFIKRMKRFFRDAANAPTFQRLIGNSLSKMMGSDVFMQKVEQIVRDRLDELTPDMVKEIVQSMMRKHLGWLVVWGGVFGGLIGFVTSVSGGFY